MMTFEQLSLLVLEKRFVPGADLSSGEDTFDMSDKDKAKTEVKRDTGGILTLRLFDFKKPLICSNKWSSCRRRCDYDTSDGCQNMF